MSTAGTLSAFPLLIRATSLANAGRLEEAAQQVIAHLRQRPEDPLGLAKLGEIAMLLGALGQAEHFFRRALAAGSRDIAVQRHLASVLNQQERLDEAATLFAALETEIDDPVIPAMRALILDKLGHNAAAQAKSAAWPDDRNWVFVEQFYERGDRVFEFARDDHFGRIV